MFVHLNCLRFIQTLQDPQPPEPWLLPYDTTKHGRCAIGPAKFHDETNKEIAENSAEDCLFLNVYTKEVRDGKLQQISHHDIQIILLRSSH